MPGVLVRSATDATSSGQPPDDSPLRSRKQKAEDAFALVPNCHAYSAPQFLRRFLEIQVVELSDQTGCQYHSFLLVNSQTFSTDTKIFLSLVCGDCRFHYHITIDNRYVLNSGTNHPRHLYIPCASDAQIGASQNTTRGNVRSASFVCAVDSCFQTVEIRREPPKLTETELTMLEDKLRVHANLEAARAEDAPRYADAPDDYGEDTTKTLITYLSDALAPRKPELGPLKIKKRNKRFKVSFGTDLDDLLGRLGFEERTDADGEECWYINRPNAVEGPTPTQTERAHVEDALAELKSLAHSETQPAWQSLIKAFNAHYPTSKATTKIDDKDVDVLGCCKDFPPAWFSWSAIRLAELCPSRRDEFLDAGIRCIGERSEEAATSIIMFKSTFDSAPSPDSALQAAFKFYGISAGEVDFIDWAEQYKSRLQRSQDDSEKLLAYTHLDEIGRHLGIDLQEMVTESLRQSDLPLPPAPSSITHALDTPMTVQSACRVLNVEMEYTAEIIIDFSKHVEDRQSAAKALEVLGRYKGEQHKYQEALDLQRAANFLQVTGVSNLDPVPSNEPVTTGIQEPQQTNDSQAPLGLRNIGNTCYLNSLLQYFYNVKTIREMVLEHETSEAELDEATIRERRTGGNGTHVSLEEAIVAQQFMTELRTLFQSLQVTNDVAACPSQKLANTALSSAKEILTEKAQAVPPPLPARPSPGPPAPAKEDVTMASAAVDNADDQPDTASTQSSATLVSDHCDTITETVVEVQSKEEKMGTLSSADEPGQNSIVEKTTHVEHAEHAGDVVMLSPPPTPTLEDKVAHISQRLEKSDRSGTSQQDVEEIIGNILEHFMRAIKPDGPMEGLPHLQADKITKTFFTTMVNSTIKTLSEEQQTSETNTSIRESLLNEEVVPERWITAFPHPDKDNKVKSTLYEALDRYFSYELLNDGKLARYTTIRSLPPIVHICIQRTDATGIKNKNPVIIPEDLFLDRYMETEKGTELWNLRRRAWAVKERVKDLQERLSFGVKQVFKPQEMHRWLGSDYESTDQLSPMVLDGEEDVNWNDPLWVDIKLGGDNKRGAPAEPGASKDEPEPKRRPSTSSGDEKTRSICTSILWDTGVRQDEVDGPELLRLMREEGECFSSMTQHKYCLHAVICHGGGMNAGHYWVWIRDFERQVWWKFNDSVVTKDSRNSADIIQELNDSGDPYYVAYIRDELKGDLVEVPQRAAPEDAGHDTIVTETEVTEGVEVMGGQEPPPQPANSPMMMPVQDSPPAQDTGIDTEMTLKN